MKYLYAFAFIAIFNSSAFACDQLEAQIIAKVERVETDSMTTCKAFIATKSVKHFAQHGLCPLDLSEIVEKGIDFGLSNGHDCDTPATISGVLVQKNGRIFLD